MTFVAKDFDGPRRKFGKRRNRNWTAEGAENAEVGIIKNERFTAELSGAPRR